MFDIKQIWSNTKLQEFIRFCIVGVIATAIHYAIYLLLIHLFFFNSEVWTNIAYSIGYIFSWCANLWLTAHFTFKNHVSVRRGVGFAISHLVNYGLHIIFLNFYLWLGLSDQWAPIPIYCIVVPINFILVRTVFKKLK
ncbi:MAG: GtrA family protein [Paludibacteraceae bacterium]